MYHLYLKMANIFPQLIITIRLISSYLLTSNLTQRNSYTIKRCQQWIHNNNNNNNNLT